MIQDRFQSRLKERIKKNNLLYFLARKIYLYPDLNVSAGKNYKRLGRLLQKANTRPKVLMLGGGINRLGMGISNLGNDILRSAINLELSTGPVVDVVGDGSQLPFSDKIFDLVIAQAVLEHVRNPIKVILEIKRVLCPGGYIYVEVPFLQPFHAYPNDYQRYTIQGVDELCRAFERIESGIVSGPSSTMVWILIEYLSILFSFNTEILYTVTNIILRLVLSPLKYIDLLLNRYDQAITIASGVYFIGRR